MENKQSAEEVTQKLIDIIIDFGDGETEFHTRDIEQLIKQNQELQKQVEELKRKLKQEVHNTDMVLEEYTKLKEAADEMAKSNVDLLLISKHYIKNHDYVVIKTAEKSVENYKQLTTEP